MTSRFHIRRATLAAALLLSFAAPAFAQKLTVGLDGTFAPHGMPKLGGGLEGFNVDMAVEIGKRLGREIEVVGQEFSGLIPGLNAKRFDFIVAPTTVTKERAENLLFTEGYMGTDYMFLLKKEAADIKQLEDLKGKVVAVNRGSIYDTWARANAEKYGFTVESYGTQPDAVQAVLAGRAFANLAGHTGTLWAAKRNPMVKASYTIKTGLVWSIPFRKDDTEMRNKVEAVVECMKKDGTFARLAETWLGYKPTGDDLLVTPLPGFGQPDFPGHDATAHTPKCS